METAQPKTELNTEANQISAFHISVFSFQFSAFNIRMNRRVLIDSPHFPPVNAPDHQRARMALPFFKEFGWEPTVLAVDANHVEAVRDPFLSQTVPGHVRVVATGA